MLVVLLVLCAALPAGAQKAAPLRQPDIAPAATEAAAADAPVADEADMARFLDRLMLAESGGRDDARNPRSTALGPFQFIESTFLEVCRRHFSAETAGLAAKDLLQLRTSRPFARKAAEAYSRDNAAHLAAAGLAPTFANLRLAFLVGAGGAARVLKAEPRTPAISVLGASVVQANPFMAGMSTADLAAWSQRNLMSAELGKSRIAVDPARAEAGSRQAKPVVVAKCSRGLASCRRWIALATKRLAARPVAQTGRRATPR